MIFSDESYRSKNNNNNNRLYNLSDGLSGEEWIGFASRKPAKTETSKTKKNASQQLFLFKKLLVSTPVDEMDIAEFHVVTVNDRRQINMLTQQFLENRKSIPQNTNTKQFAQWLKSGHIALQSHTSGSKRKNTKQKNTVSGSDPHLKPLHAHYRVKLGDRIAVHRSLLTPVPSDHDDVVAASTTVNSTQDAEESRSQNFELKGNPEIILDIVYEDDDVAVVNKPVGMAVHPSSNGFKQLHDTLVHGLLHRFGREGLSCGEPNEADHTLPGIRPGIVHRIDRDTSGLLVVARNDRAHAALKEQFASHTEVERSYLTIVHHHVVFQRGTIDVPIAKHPSIPNKRITSAESTVVVPSPAGGIMSMPSKKSSASAKHALTHYEVLERFTLPGGDANSNRFTYMSCKLETGRTHQIRVHLSSIGRPLLGDVLYGSKNLPSWFSKIMAEQGSASEQRSDKDKGNQKKGRDNKKRKGHGKHNKNGGQLLHAASISFIHPTTGERMSFTADPPAPFEAVLEYLKSKSVSEAQEEDVEVIHL